MIERVPLEAVIDLHAELLGEHGGAPGLRDRGALESALARPPASPCVYDSDADLYALAAAYARGITQNPPFVDGNKRVAFVTLGVFLTLNDIYLDATEKESEQVIIALSAGQLTEAQLAGLAAAQLCSDEPLERNRSASHRARRR